MNASSIALLLLTTWMCMLPVYSHLSLRGRPDEFLTDVEPNERRMLYRVTDSNGETRILSRSPNTLCCRCDARCGSRGSKGSKGDHYCECTCFCEDYVEDDSSESKEDDKDENGCNGEKHKGSKGSKGNCGPKESKGDDVGEVSPGLEGDDDEEIDDSSDDYDGDDEASDNGNDGDDDASDDGDDDTGDDESDDIASGGVSPTKEPSEEPTKAPGDDSVEEPSKKPTDKPTMEPTEDGTDEPTKAPTTKPTDDIASGGVSPTKEPSEEPTKAPGDDLVEEPSKNPTDKPTMEPTEAETDEPTKAPTKEPTEEPATATGTPATTTEPPVTTTEPIDSAEYCQDSDTTDASLSDGESARVADNFIPTSDGSITTITFYGAYVVSGQPVVDSSPPVDSFLVTYYEDNGGGLPGAIVGGTFREYDDGVPLIVTSREETDEQIAGAATVFEYKATHAAVPVQTDEQYWLEIINLSEDGEMQWFWARSLGGDRMAVVDGPPLNGYDPDDIEEGYDLAFCLNIPFSPEGGGRESDSRRVVETKTYLTAYLNA